MKRLLSWIVAVVLEYVLMFILSFAAGLTVRAFTSIGQLSEGLFWLAVILGGTTILGIFIWIVLVGNGAVVALSEKVCPSNKGARYIVIGTLIIAFYGFLLWATYIGATRGVSIIAEILCIINAIVFLFVAHAANAEK